MSRVETSPMPRPGYEELEARLLEAEETLRAIRSGEIDALVVSGPEGEQIYTLKTAEHPYRVLVEAMNEGAVTLNQDSTILYSNQSFANLLKISSERVLGSTFSQFVAPADRLRLEALEFTFGDKIEFFLDMRREVVVDDLGEVVGQEVCEHFTARGRDEFAAVGAGFFLNDATDDSIEFGK